MSKFRDLVIGTAIASSLLVTPALAEKLGLGRPALPEEVAAWDHDVRPDGLGLPEGSGDVLTGEEVFSEKCAVCHGEFAEGVDNWPKLAGGIGTLDHDDPLKTVGSYWPHLTTAWDYIHRSMPFGNAQSLTPDEVYAIVAYILYSNDLVDEDFVLTRENLATFELPNAGGFFVDDRDTVELPKFSVEPCMTNCKETVEITMRAAVLDVTPFDATDDAAAPAAEPAPAVAAADPELIAAGKKVFKKCASCHKVGEGAKNGTGPLLNGIVGRATASVKGFKYSKAMADAGAGGLVWTEEALAAYLADPKGYLPKNKMSFAGLKKDEERKAVIAYLATFGG
ncbi:MAG: c-type cytochrome [Rhodobacterales bacterium]|nr:c-type cytochrome [Rhodobacterales bacterium]